MAERGVIMAIPGPIGKFDGDQFVQQIDQFTNTISGVGVDLDKGNTLLNTAAASLNEFVNSMQKESHSLDEKEVEWMATSLLKLHNAVNELSKHPSKIENPNQYKTLMLNLNKLFNKTLKGLMLDPKFAKAKISVKDNALVNRVFNRMLSSVCSDAHEEVIGQERLPGALPNLIARNLLKGKNISPQELKVFKEKINQISSALYPITLLSASLDPKAPVPSVEQESKELAKDLRQFTWEYKHQFGERATTGWSDEFFGKCLKTIWETKRQQKE